MDYKYGDFVESLRRLYQTCRQIDIEFIKRLHAEKTISDEEIDYILKEEVQN